MSTYTEPRIRDCRTDEQRRTHTVFVGGVHTIRDGQAGTSPRRIRTYWAAPDDPHTIHRLYLWVCSIADVAGLGVYHAKLRRDASAGIAQLRRQLNSMFGDDGEDRVDYGNLPLHDVPYVHICAVTEAHPSQQ